VTLVNGCGPDVCPPTDPKCNPPVITTYPIRNSPINAVEYLRLAWQDRDSTHADSVLAGDYHGTSTDEGTTGTTTLSFLKSDEMNALHRLKDELTITSLTMDFRQPGSWSLEQYPGDPPDWVVVKVENPNIQMNTTNNNTIYTVSPNKTTFEFKTTPVTSGSQTLWQVVRWEEIHDSR
jgi:hypothetical protein